MEFQAALQATPTPESGSAIQKPGKTPNRDLQVTFGWDYRDVWAAECQRFRDTLDRAIENGVFRFLSDPPTLEVYTSLRTGPLHF